MPNWKKVITSGSSAQLNHITASGNISASGDLFVSGDVFAAAFYGRVDTETMVTNNIAIGNTSNNSSNATPTIGHYANTDTFLEFTGGSNEIIVSSSLLTVKGDISASGNLYLENKGLYFREADSTLRRGMQMSGGDEFNIGDGGNIINIYGGGTGVGSGTQITLSGSAVGIGTDKPKNSLEVLGAISASGTIYCHTLKQRNSGTNEFIGPVHMHGRASVGTAYTSSAELTVSGSISASGDYYAGDGIYLGGVKRTTWPAAGSVGDWYDAGTAQTSSKDVIVDGFISASQGLFLRTGQEISFDSPTVSDNFIGYQGEGVEVGDDGDYIQVKSEYVYMDVGTGVGIKKRHATKALEVFGDISASGDFYKGTNKLVLSSQTSSFSTTALTAKSGSWDNLTTKSGSWDNLTTKSGSWDLDGTRTDNLTTKTGSWDNLTAVTSSYLQNSDTGSMGNLTVEGDISASGDLFIGKTDGAYISGSQGNLEISGSGTGYLEVDGDISASGDFYSGTNKLVKSSQTGSFVVNSQTGSFVTEAETGSFAITDSSVIFNNITASGHLSASNTIYADTGSINYLILDYDNMPTSDPGVKGAVFRVASGIGTWNLRISPGS